MPERNSEKHATGSYLESPSIVDLATESLSSSRFLYALRGDAGRQFIDGKSEEQQKLYRHSERHKLKEFKKIREFCRFKSSSSGVWAGRDNDDFKQELHHDPSSGQSLSGREYADYAADRRRPLGLPALEQDVAQRTGEQSTALNFAPDVGNENEGECCKSPLLCGLACPCLLDDFRRDSPCCLISMMTCARHALP
jgi:hypothetical protein